MAKKLLQGELFEDAWVPVRSKSAKAETYEAFVEKFDKEAPKTTDDCYTPRAVYEAVVDWVAERCDIAGRAIVRPFFPGGDYMNEAYPEGCVVIDNPPFSILTKIVRWYLAHGIDFFLFAPSLTLFSTARGADVCYIVSDSSVTYENGAVVNTGFITSLFPGTRVMVSCTLKEAVAQAQPPSGPKLPTYELPANVLTAARLNKVVPAGDWDIPATQACSVAKISAMEQGLFGSGFLVSDEAAAKAAKAAKAKRTLTYPLSPQELAVVAELNEVPAISAASRVLCNRILKFINLTKEANNGEV